MPVRLPPVVEAGDGFLADVAALAEAHRSVDDPGLGGHGLGRHLTPEARASRLDADYLGGVLTDLGNAGGLERGRDRRPAGGGGEKVDPDVRGDRPRVRDG